ncbi:putative ribosome quality control (RQC) complex YloA/Tae2 family protein [Thermosporothrix hazakensis]|uniref:Rqc2 homolog RqcH n=2 Tax=Thermosporothrix TaxID=768650 RepID=A0A326URR6_THEHA|nr:NFACT RNA binding domain-containing protein [Thermosporothrix hazakensis]PZW33077.1 putative ribosome quality control (RQC) complex YloA/Tae2 family protein [Thermosporothrix hazakensis]BBH91055.1 hypothetical protein KTC_58060 [Thermosporothrix sp. COM3]GCE49108.1 hypothetical protein KTH_39770 [Thermosporothrix hazakensis]
MVNHAGPTCIIIVHCTTRMAFRERLLFCLFVFTLVMIGVELTGPGLDWKGFMQVDAITLAAVANEWQKLLQNARIDTIIQPTEHAIAMQCYVPAYQEGGGKNRWIYLSAHPQLSRVHITALKPPRITSEPPPFVMLLRKHLEGARIESIEQPRWERTIEIIAGYKGEGEARTRFRLIVEVMGRVSNIILCDENEMILGSLKRVGAEINRYRVIAPNVAYMPPPPQQRTLAGQTLPKLDPASVTAAQLAICASEEPDPVQESGKKGKKGKKDQGKPTLAQLLTRHVQGWSPLLARETVFRATEQVDTPVEAADENIWEELAWNVRDLAALPETKRWQPQLVVRKAKPGEEEQPLAFAPYALEQYALSQDVEVHESPSINGILDDYFARAEWRDAIDALRAPMRKVLQTQRDRCIRKADLLQREMSVSEEAERDRLYGQLLLAYQHEIQQGQQQVELENYFEGSGDTIPVVTIPLDPRFDAVGNANRYFTKYHKLQRALELLPEQIEQNNAELATIEQLLTDLALAETPAEIELVKAEIQAAGYMKGKRLPEKKAQKKGKGGKQTKKGTLPGGGVPMHVQSDDGFIILIGKNSRQNEEVTFHQATGNDIWLHARGVPGAHVIIKTAGREVSRRAIDQAASLAAYYSQARGSTTVPVDYTLQRHVRHMKGGGPGMVIYERERTLYASPEEATALLNR